MPAYCINPILCLLFVILSFRIPQPNTLMFFRIFSLHLSGDLQMKYAGDTETPLQAVNILKCKICSNMHFDPKFKPMFCLFVCFQQS